MDTRGSGKTRIVFSELFSMPKLALYGSDSMLLTGVLQCGRAGIGKTACGK